MFVVAESIGRWLLIHGVPRPASFNDLTPLVDAGRLGPCRSDQGETLPKGDANGDRDGFARLTRENTSEAVRLRILEVERHLSDQRIVDTKEMVGILADLLLSAHLEPGEEERDSVVVGALAMDVVISLEPYAAESGAHLTAAPAPAGGGPRGGWGVLEPATSAGGPHRHLGRRCHLQPRAPCRVVGAE